MFSRRELLKAGAAAGLAAIVGSCGYYSNSLVQYPEIGFPLSDPRAVKTKEFAEYVIRSANSHEYNPALRIYTIESNSKRQRIAFGIVINNMVYSGIVTDVDDTDEPARNEEDLISINFWALGSERHTVRLRDYGLNGACDYGFIPRGLAKDENGGDIVYDRRREVGLHHRHIFQQLYEQTLDTLIEAIQRR